MTTKILENNIGDTLVDLKRRIILEMTFKEMEGSLSNIKQLRERFCKDRNLSIL